jgi:hypothetical protein
MDFAKQNLFQTLIQLKIDFIITLFYNTLLYKSYKLIKQKHKMKK